MEDDDWLNSFSEEPEPVAEEPKPVEASAVKAAASKPDGADAAAATAAATTVDLPDIKDPNYPRKPVYNKVWMRPKFLQYKYMYKYRTNYYDDIIEYLNQRDRGLNVEFPKPQTWAERVLRTFVSRESSIDEMRQMLDNVKVTKTAKKRSGFYRTAHAKDFYCRKYKIVI